MRLQILQLHAAGKLYAITALHCLRHAVNNRGENQGDLPGDIPYSPAHIHSSYHLQVFHNLVLDILACALQAILERNSISLSHFMLC